MRMFGAFLIAFASGASAQVYRPIAPPVLEPSHAAVWHPTARYVTAGQDERGYRNWYMATPWHAAGVRAFNTYLVTYGVGGVVPTWQLLRTASDWQKCGAQPFEIAPASEWPNIVQTLRFIRDKVIPTVGPVEPVSVYRNPVLNICAGGARESAHRYVQAVDLVPLQPTSKEALMRDLCAVHRIEGERYGVGLGFYAFLRFHIDSRKFRNWGFGNSPAAEQCRKEPPRALPVTAALPAPTPDAQTRAPDPLAPKPD